MQYDVLIFMVEKGLLELQDNAASSREFKNHATELKFLDSACILDTISSKNFLCFVAVQYDDLQSLQWLCDLSSLANIFCDGRNVLHFSAYMGRIEITGWLSTQPVWQSLVLEVCWRNPF